MVSSHQPGALPLAERIVHASQAGGRNGTLIHALILGALAGGGQQWLARAHQLADPEGYQRIFIDEGVDDKIHAIPPSMDALTERELEVLRLLADGLTYAQIAEQLVVSVNTVRYHVKGIYGKLGVDKQVQAVERGRALGLL
jgi:LuxR family maltose regulon positive regulatory protein